MGIRLFIEQHMPDPQKELHLIDDALEMHGQGKCVDANVDFDDGHDASIFATIFLVKITLSNFEEALHSITKSNVDVCKEKMFAFMSSIEVC